MLYEINVFFQWADLALQWADLALLVGGFSSVVALQLHKLETRV